MKWLWPPLLLALASAAVVATEPPAAAVDPTGTWWTEGGDAQVEVARCGGALCGTVQWLNRPLGPDGCALRDVNNPDAQLRDRTVEGIRILEALRPDGPARWSGGAIYDPDSGRTYRLSLTVADPDRLELRGYIGIELLGRTTTWHRVGAARECRSAS